MTTLTSADARQLHEKLEAAEQAIPEVTYARGYPTYPDAFREFTRYIDRSPWKRTDYVDDMKKKLGERIDSLTLEETRSYLTFLTRIDRFSPGGLLTKLRDGSARGVVARANVLLEE